MKKALIMILTLLGIALLAGCGSEEQTEGKLVSEGVNTKCQVEYKDYKGQHGDIFLSKGDKVAVISPSALPDRDQTDRTIRGLKDWGYEPVEGEHVCDKTRTMEDILSDLNWALEDKEIKGIFCVRGGYGSSEVADRIPAGLIRSSNKVIIGYSDITVYHSMWTVNGVPSIHACMSETFNTLENDCAVAEENILKGKIPSYKCENGKYYRTGKAKGVLIGGNLSTFSSVLNTAYDCTKTERPYIIFFEDVDEEMQQIHRYMTILKHAGVLKNASGIVFGEWTEFKAEKGDYSGSSRGGKFKSVADMIQRQFLDDIDVPVAFGFPAGHSDRNYPLLMGEEAELTVNNDGFELECGAGE